MTQRVESADGRQQPYALRLELGELAGIFRRAETVLVDLPDTDS